MQIARIFLLSLICVLALTSCGDFNPKITDKFSHDGPKQLDKKEIRKAKSLFYKIEARYELIKTGEIIEFDYVMACSLVYLDPKTPGNSMNMDPNNEVPVRFPGSMFKSTSTGAALQISSFRICKDRKPTDAHPFTIFHPDVNDLGYGWGYATYHAYERANTDIRFISGKVTQTDKRAFKKWLKAAKKDYVQTGMIPGPFGGYGWEAAEKWGLEKPNIPYRSVAGSRSCRGYSYFKLSSEMGERARKSAPPNSTRFWNRYRLQGQSRYKDLEREKTAFDLIRTLKNKRPSVDETGAPNGQYTHYNFFEGTPYENGTGVLSDFRTDGGYSTFKPAPYYPFIGAEMGIWPNTATPVKDVLPISILFDDEYKGLVYCGLPKDAPHQNLYVRSQQKGDKIWLYVNDILVDKNSHRPFPGDHLLDNEGGVFLLH